MLSDNIVGIVSFFYQIIGLLAYFILTLPLSIIDAIEENAPR